MSKKSVKIAALIDQCQGHDLNAHYLGYFVCFNRGLFYEAHEVLEELWLADRHGPNGSFYKGLIQLAGAFVHLQKGRGGPAAALFKPGKICWSKLISARMENQEFHVRVRAVPGVVYLLEASTDFVSWTSLTSENVTSAEFELVDSNAANYPHRFYRVVAQQQ